MEFSISPEDDAFRAHVRAVLEAELPADIQRRGKHDYHSRREDVRKTMQVLDAHGWAVPHWKQEFGGTDWSLLQKHIFHDELRRIRAPVLDRSGTELIGPVICEFGSQAQQDYFLPKIRNGDIWWAQGFSEPGSGSDLASLRTRADLTEDGKEYVVNGSKIWTTEGHYAEWMFALVRTNQNVKPQAGISFLIIDMKAPGVTLRPIWSIDEGHTVNEVFLDDVRVPAENIIGEVDKGWSYAKFLLSHERTGAAVVSHTKRDVEQVRYLAERTRRGKGRVIDDPGFAAKLARLEAEVIALEWTVIRVLHAEEGDASANSAASLLKIRGSELSERVALLAAEALGDYGVAAYPDPEGLEILHHGDMIPPIDDDEAIGVTSKAIFRRACTIYGGANEIQRTLIAKTVLDL